MKKITFALITGALTIGVAAAQETDKPRRDPKQAFSRMDTNSDGKIELNEFLRKDAKSEERRTAFFKKLDANADGFVTTEEFQAFAGKHHRRERGEQPQQQN
jgi:Ca2+-binding EF-hand superfamily protein